MSILKGKVAIVTGASRNAGRGIARVLGEAGATVYVTGRSVRNSKPTTAYAFGNIDETAEIVTAQGGVGIPVACDHSIDAEVAGLFDRVKQEQGRLDLLVNNVWGGYENMENFDAPFWEQSFWRWDKMFTAGVRAHFTASCFAVPLMIPQRQGLIINTSFWDQDKYFKPLPYHLAKTTINRMAYGIALELREHNIAAVALSPGWLRTEHILREYQTDDLNAHMIDALATTESTQYIGRAVVALMTDPNIMQKSGRVLTVGDLAREYDFTDIDGRQVSPFRISEEHFAD
ncbi:MAG: oxidoreductase [Chloroflexi bacterium HGW-Chloroflexi-10]|nr:MAG: oxidoreductase [Chloroflexi bacterium HGW-Chloroflexi-10]